MNSNNPIQSSNAQSGFLGKKLEYKRNIDEFEKTNPSQQSTICISNESNYMVIKLNTDDEFIILDKTTLSEVKKIKFKSNEYLDRCESVIFDSQGQNFFSVSRDGYLQSYNIETGNCIDFFKLPSGLIKLLKFSENKLFVYDYSVHNDHNIKSIYTLDITSNKIEKEHSNEFKNLNQNNLSADGKFLVCPLTYSNVVEIYNIDENIFSNKIKIVELHWVSNTKLSFDNSLLICSSTHNLIVIYNVAKKCLYKKIDTKGMKDCAFSLTSDNKYMIFHEGSDSSNLYHYENRKTKIRPDYPKKFYVYDLEKNEYVDEFDNEHIIHLLHLDEDNQKITVVSKAQVNSFPYNGSMSHNMKLLHAGLQFETASYNPESYISLLPKEVRTLIYTNFLLFNISENKLRNLTSIANKKIQNEKLKIKIEALKIDLFFSEERKKVENLKQEAAQLGLLRKKGGLPKDDVYAQILSQLSEIIIRLKTLIISSKNLPQSSKDEIICLDNYLKEKIANKSHLAAYNLALVINGLKVSQSRFADLHQTKLANNIASLIAQAISHSDISIDKINVIDTDYSSSNIIRNNTNCNGSK